MFLVKNPKNTLFTKKPEKPRFRRFIDKTILLQLMTIALLRLYITKRKQKETVKRDHTVSLI
jgi:hypothetical protein